MTDQVKYTQKLKGAKVLVIGGSSGIGYGVAEALVENGSTVIVSSSNPSRVESTVEKLKKSYPSATSRISGHACNLGEEASLEDNIKNLFEAVGQLDHVVYTAGDALAMMEIDSIDLAKVKQAGMVRFFGPLLVAKYAPKYLKKSRESSITLTTGSVSEKPRPQWAVVNAYATGLQGMCRGLALDLKPIRVNLISPGAVDTELWANVGVEGEAKQKMFDEIESHIPTGKVASVSDLAEAYLYVLKDQNITGTMVSSNGGALIA